VLFQSLRAVAKWAKNGSVVSQQESNRRGAICSTCPLNVSIEVVMLLIISKEADGIRFEPKLVRAFTNDDMMVELEKYVIGLGDPANYIG